MFRKALIRRLILSLALTGPPGCAGTTAEAGGVVTEDAPVDSYNIFYTALSPYGEWFWIDDLDDVWQPSIGVVGTDVTPYLTGGHWILSSPSGVFDAEWDRDRTPIHHGRWRLTPESGWVWVPGHRDHVRS